MLLGLLPAFRRSGSTAALVSWAAGVGTFFFVRFVIDDASLATQVAAPVLSSLLLFTLLGWLRRSPVSPQVDVLLSALNQDRSASPEAVWRHKTLS